MRQDRISGIAIITGSVMAVVTMGLHPVGGHLRSDLDYLTRVAPVAVAVHVLALAAIGVQAFGFLGFHRALGPDDARARAGLVAYVVSWGAVFAAALASGILTSEMIGLYPDLDLAEQSAMHVIWDYNRMVFHALDKVWIVATGIGTILWCLASWRHGWWWKAASAVGIVVSSIGLLALVTGHFRMSVTDVGLFVSGLTVWWIGVGALLCRPGDAP